MKSMTEARCSSLARVACVLAVCVGMSVDKKIITAAGQAESGVFVAQDGDAYVLRYQDPAYDNEWREIRVPAGQALDARVVCDVRPYAGDLLQYDYTVANTARSSESVSEWSIQVAVDSEIPVAPIGWQQTRGSLSFVTWIAEQGQAVAPSAESGGWRVISAALPAVKPARLRGTTELNLSGVDVPPSIKAQIRLIEERNVTERSTLVPWIKRADESNLRGLRAELGGIIAVAAQSYAWPMRLARATVDRVAMGTSDGERRLDAAPEAEAIRILQDVPVRLAARDVAAASQLLKQAHASLTEQQSRPNELSSLRGGLRIVVDYLADSIQAHRRELMQDQN